MLLSSRTRLPLCVRCTYRYFSGTCANVSKIQNCYHAIALPAFRTLRIDGSAARHENNTVVCCRRFCTEQTMSVIFHVENEEDFAEKVLNSSVPVLVDFYADWCGPCKMLGPRIEAKVIGREGSILLAKVNVDYATDLAMDYEVNAVPTIIAIKSGEIVGRFEGVQSDDELDQFIDGIIDPVEQ